MGKVKYMGSKNRIAKEILSIILKDRKEGQWYIEPFCGGLGTMDKVNGKRLASDKNKYLIAMWIGLQQGKKYPKRISRELYCEARTEYNNGTNINFDDFMIGWIGWMGSYNGRFFDGGYSGKSGKRDYVDEQTRNTIKQIEKIDGIIFKTGNYDELDYPEESIIYCDIPYKGTKQYATSKDFNYDNFWTWVKNMTKDGHKVFVSEYNAPAGFKCVWSGKIKSYMKAGRSEDVTENIFIFELNSEEVKTCATKHDIPPKPKDSGILSNFT